MGTETQRLADVALDEIESPSQGRMTFGWEAPLTVQGVETAITGFPRHDNPWAHTGFNTRTVQIEDNGYGLRSDLAQGTREVYAPH